MEDHWMTSQRIRRSAQRLIPMHQMFPKNQHGQGIIQVLISIALFGIIASAFAILMNNQWRETIALSEKLAAGDLQQLLTSSLANGSVCSHVLNNPAVLTFDSTQPLPQVINLTNPTAATGALYLSMFPNAAPPPATIPGPVAAQVGQPASPSSSSLVVKSIQLHITAGSGSSYSGHWQVNFDPTKTVRPVRPVSVQTSLTVNTSVPTAATITGCSGMGGSGGSGGAICGMRQILCSNSGTLQYDQCYCGVAGQSVPCQGIPLQISAAGPGPCVPTGSGTTVPNADNISCPAGYSGHYVWSGWGPSGWGVWHIFCVQN